MTKLHTRAEVAKFLRVSERTLRRILPTVPGLAPINVGRRTLLSDDDVARIIEALRRPIGRVEGRGTTHTIFRVPSGETAQERLRREFEAQAEERKRRRAAHARR